MIRAISVKDRLKKQAMEDGKTMQDKLVTYGLERTIYRLSVSQYAERFTLKGGIFLYALFDGEYARATMDIDLLAQRIPNDAEKMKKVFNDIFSIECDDALRFDLNTLEVTNITEFKEYHGVNVSITGYLDRTKVPVSIDIGFGDVIYPERMKMEFPVLLDMEVPEVYAYSIYSVIAEKFEAIVSECDNILNSINQSPSAPSKPAPGFEEFRQYMDQRISTQETRLQRIAQELGLDKPKQQ